MFALSLSLCLADIASDPCESNTCSLYAECVRDPDAPHGHHCLCAVGFAGDGHSCRDVDECAEAAHDCHPDAACYNRVGHFECRCLSPYAGDGRQCDLDALCQRCDANARCARGEAGQRACECNVGFRGDGLRCEPDQTECLVNMDISLLWYTSQSRVP